MAQALTLEKIKAVKEGLSHYFPFEAGETTNSVFTNDTWSDLDRIYKWKGRDDYFTTLSEVTGIQNLKEIKKATFILDDLEKNFSNITPTPEYVSNTTLTPDQIENFDKDVERQKKSEEIRASQKGETERFKKRGEELYSEQQKIQEQITKSKAAADEIAKLKPLYIKVEEVEKVQFTSDEKKKFEDYRKEAIEQPDEKVVSVAREIHKAADKVLESQGYSKEEVDLLVNRTAKKIVTELKTSTTTTDYVPPIAQLSINNAVYEKVKTLPKSVVSSEAKEALLSTIGINTKYRFDPNRVFGELTEVTFGPTIARTIFGSNYKVTVSETPIPGQTNTFNFAVANESGRQIYEEQNQMLLKFQSFVGDTAQSEARSYLLNQSAIVFTRSSVGKAVLANTKAEVAFYSVFKGAGKTVTWTGTGIGKYVVGTGYENALYLATGTKYMTPAVSLGGSIIGTTLAAQTAATATTIATTGGIMASEAFLGGAGAAAAGAAAGTAVAPIVGTILGGIAGAVGGKVVSDSLSKLKAWWTKNKDSVAPVVAIGSALALSRFGFGPAILGGVGTFALFGGSVAGLGLGIWRFFGFIGRSIGITIATPVIITLLVLPPLVALIMLVINNSAYVVPPGLSSSSRGADNPYMLVTKTATPTKLDNSSSPQTVIYLVTVTALKNNLTNLKLVGSECNVIKKDKSKVNCPTEFLPEIDPGQSVSPTQPYAFTFTGIYDGKYADSLIYDSITFSADVDGKTITTSGSASVCIGECPANCAVISDNADTWPSSSRSKAEAGVGILSQYQGFTAKACPNNEPINLCYRPSQISQGLYAWHVHNSFKDNCDVYFNDGPFNSRRDELDAAFIITHELTHHVQRINAGPFVGYIASGSFWELNGKGLCTYTSTAGGPLNIGAQQEAMAEAAALYVNSSPSWDTCATNYKSLYPKNYIWSQDFMTK